MYLAILFALASFVSSALFPILKQQFDFRTPGSSRNSILAPRSPEHTSRENGKIEANGILRADTAVLGNFSQVRVSATVAKDSAVPNNLTFRLRRSYQSFFYPTGENISQFPSSGVTYLVDGVYYTLKEGTLYPFVSEQAFTSHAPKDRALIATKTLLDTYSVSEQWLGFRVGSLLGNATGVFVVVSDTEVRPVGSAEIFLALGYNFDDVISVNEEELGVYKRGRILLLGAAHPDGTLLYDQDTDTHYLIEQGTKRPFVQPSPYLDFLLTEQKLHPILVSKKASEQTASCLLVPNFFATGVTCTAPAASLSSGFGNDFELELSQGESDIDINMLTVSFETAKNKENMMTLLSKVKQRLLSRLGGAAS